MKKILALLSLLILVQAACSFSPSQDATRVAFMQTSVAAAWTPTPDFTARLGVAGADLYAGPGEIYPRVASVTGSVTITGQALGCTWFLVNAPAQNVTGWLRAEQITYTIACPDVPGAPIPPTPQPTPTATPLPLPTDTPIPTATNTLVPTKKPASVPGSNPVNCLVNSNIIIANHSGAPFTLFLTGPARFTFYLGAEDYSTVLVCSGSYDYTVTGTCNGSPASGSGRISDGDQVTFFCS